MDDSRQLAYSTNQAIGLIWPHRMKYFTSSSGPWTVDR